MCSTTPTSLISPRRKLPIGIQTFAKLREDGCYYVDKTALAMQLIQSGSYYFLSRPRRFGKSLFLDTLRELFKGNQALFKGLAAENTWDWSQKYPVIRISFGGGVLRSVADLGQSLHQQLTMLAQSFGSKPQIPDHRSRFKELITHVAASAGQRAVVLVIAARTSCPSIHTARTVSPLITNVSGRPPEIFP